MIASRHIRQNCRRLHARQKRLVHAMVVDSPPDILFAGVESVAPPSVLLRFSAKMSECVDESALRELVHPRAFFGQKSRVSFVRLWVRQIDWLVRDVVVAAKHNVYLLRYQILAI